MDTVPSFRIFTSPEKSVAPKNLINNLSPGPRIYSESFTKLLISKPYFFILFFMLLSNENGNN